MTELVTRSDLDAAITSVRQEIRQEIAMLRQEMANQTLRLTVRTGIMLAAAISILAALQRLH